MQTQLLKKLCDVTDLISASFNVFFKNIVNLFWFKIIAVAAALAAMVPFGAYALVKAAPLMQDFTKDMPDDAARELMFTVFKTVFADPTSLILLVLFIILSMIAGSWVVAAVSSYLEGVLLGGKPGVFESFKKTTDRILPLALTMLAVSIVIYAVPLLLTALAVASFIKEAYAAGALTLVLAFITFFIAWFVFMAVMPLPRVLALKNKDYMEAVKYAWRLVKGGYWPAVGLLILTLLIVMGFGIVAGIAQILIQLLGGLLGMLGGMLSPFIAVIVMTLVILVIIVVRLLPQCYADVPLMMYYVNREAMQGDGVGVVAEAARTAAQTPAPDANPVQPN